MARKPSRFRLRFETVGSITAIIVGVAALYVSWDQARVMRGQMAASVWPAVQVDGFADASGGDMAVGVRLHNAGVGPAIIERITVRRNGELVSGLSAMTGLLPDGFVIASAESVTGRLLAAGDSVQPYVFRGPAEGTDAVSLIASLAAEWTIEVCYCSVLGQCWTSDAERGSPSPARQCAAEPGSGL